MGEVEVPARAYYGAQTERARRNFPIGGGPIPRPLIRALGWIKWAAAAENAALQRLDGTLADAIQRAAREVAEGRHDAEFVVDVFQTGSGTSSNMNANEVIANRAAEMLGESRGAGHVHPNDHVNAGQSSNDVFPSAIQLALVIDVELRLLPALRTLGLAWRDRAAAGFEVIKNGRTHLMDALPIRFGQEFGGYAEQIERGAVRIAGALDAVRALPLGGTAVGTGIGAAPEFAAGVCRRLTEEIGLSVRETEAHFQAQSCLDGVVELSGSLRTMATALYKIANDVRWMASGPLSGLAEVEIPAVQPGSSIMPAKVNPVICEATLMACAQVQANDFGIAFGNSQGQFELNTMLPLIARSSIESVRILGGAARTFADRCVANLRIVEDGEAVARNPILATALNPEIGYERAAAIAKAAAAEGRTVRDVAAEQSGLAPARLDELLDPRRLTGASGSVSDSTDRP